MLKMARMLRKKVGDVFNGRKCNREIAFNAAIHCKDEG